MNIGAGIMGDRRTKIFFITTDGRVDNFVARIILWVSARTWGRYTRWYPQNIVTISAMLYFLAGMANTVLTKEYLGWGALNVVIIAGVTALLEWESYKMRGLSGRITEITLAEVLAARRTAGMRAFTGPILISAVVGIGLWHDLAQATNVLALFGWMWGLYTVTMGRSGVPPKKARRKLRLPSIPKLPRLLPVPTP